LAIFLVLHPLADKIRAPDDAELTTLTACEIHESGAIQLFKMSQIKQRPQGAIDRGRNELVEVGEMALRQRASDANGYTWRNEF
jgi:hypothetical protein